MPGDFDLSDAEFDDLPRCERCKVFIMDSRTVWDKRPICGRCAAQPARMTDAD